MLAVSTISGTENDDTPAGTQWTNEGIGEKMLFKR